MYSAVLSGFVVASFFAFSTADRKRALSLHSASFGSFAPPANVSHGEGDIETGQPIPQGFGGSLARCVIVEAEDEGGFWPVLFQHLNKPPRVGSTIQGYGIRPSLNDRQGINRPFCDLA